ncbi:LptE family protein [Pedobacter sp. ASV28]|jgi:Lipopolysaccharide-assembly|uniref:LptE family protein n=1 Tax=Pedobacter sp. ASV28 TaxID=2795123 RepID=UPI0018EAB291|nr:LptE family protein [Pedobacter sp. ASV28]
MKKIIWLFIAVTFIGCSYKFNGASIPPGMKTINVRFFENNAPLVVPNLSQQFTEDLKERIRTQSSLTITQGEADAVFEGRITGYEIKPIAFQDNTRPTAGGNRLTITVSVKYTNSLDTGKIKNSFDETFSAFTDFTLEGRTLQSLEQGLIKKVNTQLTENIFNRAFAQW